MDFSVASRAQRQTCVNIDRPVESSGGQRQTCVDINVNILDSELHDHDYDLLSETEKIMNIIF